MGPGELYQLHKLMKNQWLKTSQIEEIQQRKLRKLLKHAYNNVPYYRQLFDSAGVKPGEIKTVDDLPRIPVTTKEHLRNLPFDQIIAKGININKCVKRRTSGSTGIPLDSFVTKKDFSFRPLLDFRILYSNGYKWSDKILALILRKPQKRWFQHLGIMRRKYISILDSVEEQIENIQRINPDIIWGVTSNIVLLATIIKRDKIQGIQPRLIYTMAELLDQKHRKLINSAFGVDPLDYYGSQECGSIAWECTKRRGYHINTDSLIVEATEDGRRVQPGENGELVITNLHSYAMPFIRYSVGDVGILSDELCPCGRGLPLMSIIEGRVVDFIVLPDGRKISPWRLTCTVRNVPGVLRYQIIQDEKGRIIVKLIKGEGFSLETISKIKEKCKGVLGDNIKVKPVLVGTLAKDKSGKFRLVISKVRTG